LRVLLPRTDVIWLNYLIRMTYLLLETAPASLLQMELSRMAKPISQKL
jgi:hypothetical protein